MNIQGIWVFRDYTAPVGAQYIAPYCAFADNVADL